MSNRWLVRVKNSKPLPPLEPEPFNCCLAHRAFISSQCIGWYQSKLLTPLFVSAKRERDVYRVFAGVPLHFLEGELRGRYRSVEGRRESIETCWSVLTACGRPSVAFGLLREHEPLK